MSMAVKGLSTAYLGWADSELVAELSLGSASHSDIFGFIQFDSCVQRVAATGVGPVRCAIRYKVDFRV